MARRIVSWEPATGKLLWEGEAGDPADEVERARSAWPAWSRLSLVNRMETIRRFANAVRTEEASLAELVARETGRPLWDADAEIAAVLTAIETAIAALSERTGHRRMEAAMGARHALRHKPLGVVAIITPHCLPLQIPAAQIVAALLAGNCVVFKPSEHAHATAVALVSLLDQAGVPRDALRLLRGGPETGAALVQQSGVDGIFFTGTTRNGRAVHAALSGRPETLLALHMSGNNPVVVWDTPDLASAATLVIQSAFAQAGQHCASARRLIVREELANPLLAEMKKLLDRLVIDEPFALPAPFMGPVLNTKAADSLSGSTLDMMSRGGRPVRHPTRSKGALPFLTPAIIDVTAVAERADQELFGPVLQLVRVAEFDDAIAEANATRYGLSAALIGGSPEHYDRFFADVRAGVINWNRPTTAISSSAPFGGIAVSGNGRPAGAYLADSCAYPVASAENEQPRALIGIGLAPVDTAAMGD